MNRTHKYKRPLICVIILLAWSTLISQDESWEYIGFEDEPIRSIVIDAFNDSIIYIGTGNLPVNSDPYITYYYKHPYWGGLFKSFDAGATWDTLLYPVSVNTIVQHPQEQNTLYAGLYYLQPDTNSALIKTVDGGQEWYITDNGIPLEFGNCEEGVCINCITSIAIDPVQSDTMYAGLFDMESDGSVYRSGDGGSVWENIGQTDHAVRIVLDVEINPLTPNHLFFWGFYLNIIMVSTDYGENWIPRWTNNQTITTNFCIDYQQPEIVYTSQKFIDYVWPGILKSYNSGYTWYPMTSGMEGIGINKLAMHPAQPDILYAGTEGHGVYKTINGGEEWFLVNNDLPGDCYISAMDISASGSFLLNAAYNPDGTYYGVFKSSIQNGQEVCNLPGDVNNDNNVDILDIIQTIDYIFNDIYDICADINGDDMLNIIDIVLMVDIIIDY